MAVRLDESDEAMHELGPESNFNESMYINCFDPKQGVGGWFRIGNRANEGYAEMTVCLYLPASDGTERRQVAFQYRRPEITTNDAFDAGGLTWTMHTAFEHLAIDYAGKVLVLDDPEHMATPREAFKNNPFEACEVHLNFTGQGRRSMFGGEPDEPHETPGEEFAKGHYEQLIAGTGTIRVGDREWHIDGFGLRDHSWGPRYWQAPWYYRWLTGNVDAGLGFMASRVAKKDGPGTRGGFVWEDGTMHYCDSVTITTATRGDVHYHDTVSCVLASSRSNREWHIDGEAIDLIPLRNRRQTPDGEWLQTRISEAYTQWTVRADDTNGRPDDRVGFGMSEYLDQIIDGRPVGVDE